MNPNTHPQTIQDAALILARSNLAHIVDIYHVGEDGKESSELPVAVYFAPEELRAFRLIYHLATRCAVVQQKIDDRTGVDLSSLARLFVAESRQACLIGAEAVNAVGFVAVKD